MLTHEIEQANCKICSFLSGEVSSRIISHRSTKNKFKKKQEEEEKKENNEKLKNIFISINFNFKKMHKNSKFPEEYHTDVFDDTQTRKPRVICDCQTNVLKFPLLLWSTTARHVLR